MWYVLTPCITQGCGHSGGLKSLHRGGQALNHTGNEQKEIELLQVSLYQSNFYPFNLFTKCFLI